MKALLAAVLVGLFPVAIPAYADDTKQTSIRLGGAAGGNLDGGASATGLVGYETTTLRQKQEKSVFRIMANLVGAKTISGGQENFGVVLQNPGLDTNGVFVEFHENQNAPGFLRPGWFSRGGISWSTWQTSSNTTSSGFIGYATGGARWLLNPSNPNSDNQVETSLELGPTIRIIGGNLAQDDDVRKNILGTHQTVFPGIEGTLYWRINDVRFFARASWFPAAHNIRSFSGTQAFIGSELSVDFFHAK